MFLVHIISNYANRICKHWTSQKNEIFSRTNGQKIVEIQSWKQFLVYGEDARATQV